jgi:ATP-dependent DNA ligase
MHIGSETAARRLTGSIPVVYMAFDLLYLDGRPIMGESYVERRRLLESLDLSGASAVRVPAYHRSDGKAMLEASRAQELEGVVAKRLESTYQPGRRTSDWIKVKNRLRQEFVIGGWLPGQGTRAGRVGSLAVGVYDVSPEESPEKAAKEAERRGASQRLTYVGNVGTGFKAADLVRLGELLEPLRREDSPFEGRQPPKETVFVEPRLVGEVEFRGWTHKRTLRAPSFRGLRDDKPAQEVVAEGPEGKVEG